MTLNSEPLDAHPSDADLIEAGIDLAKHEAFKKRIRAMKEASADRQPLTEEELANLEALHMTLCTLRAGGYEGSVEIWWDTDGKARLHLDPQAGRSTDEPPVC